MIRSTVSPARGLLNAACVLAALAAPAQLCAQSEHPTRIETVIVSAARTPQDPSVIPSSVSLLPLAELEAAQIPNLSVALNLTPGVNVGTYGAIGGQSTLSLRGASSAQSLIVVDGVRMNSRQSDGYMRSILGNQGLAGFDRIEVLRGPQGTLYGSSAMGGVLLMETTHGCGPLSGRVGAEVGALSTWNLASSLQGGTQNLGYSASLGWDRTANATPHNENRSLNFSTRLERTFGEGLLLGTTFRGQENRFNSPGSRLSPDLGNVDSSNFLGTVYAGYTADAFRSRLTLGWHQVSYDYGANDWFSGLYTVYRYLNTRNVLDWQNAWTPVKSLVLVGGANAEWAHFNNSSLNGALSSDSEGVYLNANYTPTRDLALQAGGRYDHFQSIGEKTTGRAGASYMIRATGTKLRATLGTAFSVPGMTERFGDKTWYVENASLRPESSTGWDLGLDQQLFGGRLVLETGFFRNDFRDMIVANAVAGYKYQYQNVARAHTQGVESALLARLSDSLRLRTSYTYTDVVDETARTRVVYKPRHTASADLQWQATRELVLGSGLHLVSDRLAKKDWVHLTHLEDFTTVRLYASYQAHRNLLLKARVENALNERYDDTYGYAGLPVAVYGGVEYRF